MVHLCCQSFGQDHDDGKDHRRRPNQGRTDQHRLGGGLKSIACPVIRFEMMPYNYFNAELKKDQETAAEKLARGYVITVRCETMRFILGSPFGSGCSIVPPDPPPAAAKPAGASPQQQASSPSFDCGKATTNVETMICRSRELSESDAIVAKLYFDTLAKATDKQAAQAAQVKWRTGRRDKCQTVDCLVLAYGDRERELRALTP